MLWILMVVFVVLWLVMLSGVSVVLIMVLIMVLVMEWVDLNIGMIYLSMVSRCKDMWLYIVVLAMLVNLRLLIHVSLVVSKWSIV